jgi:hypothetical protein
VEFEVNVQYWFLRREVELLSGLGAEIADRFDHALGANRDADAADLVRPLVRVATRLSHLLWPTGSWATDPESLAAAEALRRELDVEGNHPLSPGVIVSYTAVAPMSSSELRRAIDPRRQSLRIGQQEYSIEPILSSLRELHGRVAAAAGANSPG